MLPGDFKEDFPPLAKFPFPPLSDILLTLKNTRATIMYTWIFLERVLGDLGHKISLKHLIPHANKEVCLRLPKKRGKTTAKSFLKFQRKSERN